MRLVPIGCVRPSVRVLDQLLPGTLGVCELLSVRSPSTDRDPYG